MVSEQNQREALSSNSDDFEAGSQPAINPAKSLGFFSDRWRAKVNLRRLFWFDMLAVGTLINLFAGFAALMVMAQVREPTWAICLHFSTLPYNAFLLAAIWRFPAVTPAMRLSASLWFVAMTVV